jgi:hypothetical protein
MLIISTLYVKNERYFEALKAVFEYSDGQVGKWFSPVRGRSVSRFEGLGVTTGNMTVSLWLRIDQLHPTWRNVYHLGSLWHLRTNRDGNPVGIEYNQWDDVWWNRRPALFIKCCNESAIHICHDTYHDRLAFMIIINVLCHTFV